MSYSGIVKDVGGASTQQIFMTDRTTQVDVQLRLMPEQLWALIGSYSTLVVCGETQVTDELLAAVTRLQVVGLAGSRLDNIDLEAVIRRGVLVVNAPGGNVIAAAEHTIALLLALS